MTFKELETKLGAGGRRYLLQAYKTKNYLDQARHKNLNVTPKRVEAVLEAISQHEKELKAAKKWLKKELA